MIQGEGMDYDCNEGTVIKAPDNLNDHVIKINGNVVPASHRVNIVIKDLSIHGRNTFQTSGNLIDINGAYGVKIYNCMLSHAKDYGIQLTSGEQITIESCFFMLAPIYFLAGIGCYVLNNEIGAGPDLDGIYIRSSNSAYNVIANNIIYMCRDGILLYGDVEHIIISDNLFWQNGQSAIDINSNCSFILIEGNQILSNSTAGVANWWNGVTIRNDIGTGCDNIAIVGNSFDDYQLVPTQSYHVRTLDDTDSVLIADNVFGTALTGMINLVGVNNRVCDNLGYNPVAASTPAVGASPVTFGPYWYPVYVEVVGNVTGLTVRGQATSIAFGAGFEGSYMLYPGDTIVITYPVGAPTVTLWPQ